MMVNGDYRAGGGSNYTMSSDDEVFNFPPIKKTMHNHSGLKDGPGMPYHNNIVKPYKKKPNPKLHMAGLSGTMHGNMHNPHLMGGNMMISGNAAMGMKHNSSNQSIHSQKKVNITNIKKPGGMAQGSLENSFTYQPAIPK